jgi:type II secretory pathway pseudopilin PulG
MQKGETVMAGQLWIQGDRMMSAANPAFPGMPNTSEAALLSAVAEAVEWRTDALEPSDPPRKGQRVVIYPKDLWSLEEALVNESPDFEDHQEIACQRIAAAANQFESTPQFLKEDCEPILSDPRKAELVPQWMNLAEQVALGCRPRVLQDGPDTHNSDDEAKEDVIADKETGMFAPGMTPNIAAAKISSATAAQLRAQQASLDEVSTVSSSPTVSSDFGNSIVNSPQSSSHSSRPPSPPYEAEEDGSWMTPAQRAKAETAARAMAAKEAPSVDHRSLIANSQRCADIPRCSSAPGERPPKS